MADVDDDDAQEKMTQTASSSSSKAATAAAKAAAARCHTNNKRKVRALRDEALFLWPEVASFCSPQQVCTLERVCRDVAAAVHAAETGTRVMQRYWHAQYARLLWPEESLSREKRLLLPSSLSRSEGRKAWRALFIAEYPQWLQRHYRGYGVDNNAVNEARVRFHRQALNVSQSAEELAARELTVHEAMLKAMVRRGVTVDVGDAQGTTSSPLSSPLSLSSRAQKSNGSTTSSPTTTASSSAAAAAAVAVAAATANSTRVGRGNKREDKKLARVTQRTSTAGAALTRDDYHMDQRQGARKGKHAKGMSKKWSSFNDAGEYDD